MNNTGISRRPSRKKVGILFMKCESGSSSRLIIIEYYENNTFCCTLKAMQRYTFLLSVHLTLSRLITSNLFFLFIFFKLLAFGNFESTGSLFCHYRSLEASMQTSRIDYNIAALYLSCLRGVSDLLLTFGTDVNFLATGM